MLIFLLPVLGKAQPVPKSFRADTLQQKFKFPGKVVHAARWVDKLGTNSLILTEGKETWHTGKDGNGDSREKSLYAYHIINGDSLLWKLTDYVRDCPLDVITEFRAGSVRITDLDKNGISETWMMYSTTCTGDVSVRTLKLVLHQGSNKYVIRGTSQTSSQMMDNEAGGKFVPDWSFGQLPDGFLEYAKALWVEYLFDYPDEATK
ncbi:M949_RS01915 family surface polysaccharide biosynthesis protein [Flavihumibacter petaseus]|uniref:Uncharacterized protein n=1 Tax=Flavihumibacter petaseus NBRC 106054 TaxID=1220578 RepID=A0A0E9N472_9BACT|nr:hypothetical protein [Flavihumibacter petaseus]GAO44165.1 hypothetical protein FPE01S_03_02030 [Flavihumibacter petaseus NBRC 106054]